MEVCEEVATNLQILLDFMCVLGGACLMELEWNSQILSLCSDQMKTPFLLLLLLLLLLLRLLHIVTHGTNFGILARTSAASSALTSLSVLH